MSAYKVWIHIERNNFEIDDDRAEVENIDTGIEFEDIGIPEEAGAFDTLEEAEKFVQFLMEQTQLEE